MIRPWDTLDQVSGLSISTILETCKKRVDAAFDFFTLLGVDYYSFHDRDVSPEMESIEATNDLLDQVTDYMLEKQKQTGVKLLWVFPKLIDRALLVSLVTLVTLTALPQTQTSKYLPLRVVRLNKP
jgi:xylose isomerase